MPAANPDNQVTYWGKQIELAKKRYRTFWDAGDTVVDAYRLQKADGNEASNKDKYNILYSSTETIRPNLYAQQPKVRVKLRSVDTAAPTARVAARLLEGCIEYLQHEEQFDDLMNGVVEDVLLPGLGQAWVRYEANFEDQKGEDGKPVLGDDGEPRQQLLDEMVCMDYVYWQDFLTGVARRWKDVPWVARRLWKNKAEASKLWGAVQAGKLKYVSREGTARESDTPTDTAEIWEIWDKTSRTVYWWAEGLDKLLDEKPDFLKLKDFYPCPRPMRAISNTRTMVPRALYSQYKTQAETLNTLTKRIRLLAEALRVTGLYDGSLLSLATLLEPNAGNKMVAVDSWATFAQNGGIQGSVQFMPIDMIAKVLTELLQAREVCKNEIYEITGFSDIVRGVSKASETLGAQNIKANWAGARVKQMQGEVQRFARDVLALAGELVAEHCGPETIALFSGLPIPDPAAVQQNPALQKKVQEFTDACALIKNEMRRVSTMEIETNSTLLADEESEREDRTKFLAAAGAFLQQAVPAMGATPELGPLLGAMLMFVVRTFPASRPIEEEFEKVQGVLDHKMQNPDQDKNGEKAKHAVEQQRVQAEAQHNAAELQQKATNAQMQHEREVQAENNRHAERMAELNLKRQEVALEMQRVKNERFKVIHDAGIAEMGLEAEATEAVENTKLEYASLDHESSHRDADREASTAEAEADRAHEADQADADREAAAEQARQDAAEAQDGPSGDAGGDDAP
jgi:hypothetical protein